MQPYLTHKKYFSPAQPNPRADRTDAKAGDGVLRQWLRSAVRRRQRNRLIAELHAMDDRLLRDIGIYRGDIRRVVDGFDDREMAMTPFAPKGDRPGNMAARSNWRTNAFL